MKTMCHHMVPSLTREEMNALARKNGSQFTTAKEQARGVKAGWIFLFNSVEFMESGDILCAREQHEAAKIIPWCRLAYSKGRNFEEFFETLERKKEKIVRALWTAKAT